MPGKKFPIKTPTSCRSKWAISTLHLGQGYTAGCHRSSRSQLTVENFNNFHNTNEKIRDRKLMLDGKWPINTVTSRGGCDYCRHIEEVGGMSDRLFQNTVSDVYPQELDKNPTQTNVEPVSIEVFFQNTCSLSCLYCKGELSSKIASEEKQYNDNQWLRTTGKINYSFKNDFKNVDVFSSLFFKWLEKNVTKLKRLQVLGGEPLLQEEFYKTIEILNNNESPDLELTVISNLMVPDVLFEKFISEGNNLMKNKKIKEIHINASIDGWGPEAEYVRAGLKINEFENNMKKLLERTNFRMSTMSTINTLTFKTMPDLFMKMQEWNKIRRVFWYPNMLQPVDDHILSPVHFDQDTFDNDFEKINSILAQDTSKDGMIAKLQFLGFYKTIKNKPSNYKKIDDLIVYLDLIEQRKGIKWKDLFPWLNKYYNEIKLKGTKNTE